MSQVIDRDQLCADYERVRSFSLRLCQPLQIDDFQIQSIAQTSPPKWHLAHVTWFFETFVLAEFSPDYQPFHPCYDFLFNSYYFTHGEMHSRPRRGLLSRPTVGEILEYRQSIDGLVLALIRNIDATNLQLLADRITLGLHHEQQHQELLLMDIKHNFFVNPLRPAYRDDLQVPSGSSRPMRWVERAGGQYEIGAANTGFAYDNEMPRHPVLVGDHRLADRLVTNAEYLEFIQDQGYANPALWLSDGWTLIHQENWQHPLYWEKVEGEWQQFTLGGMRELNPDEPVCHLGFYEADAYARWAGKRLPLEAELELQLADSEFTGNFVDDDMLHPAPAGEQGQWCGDLWAWTASPYVAYPGFKPLSGTMAEYNGKFMSNQMVLRGGCCATSADHMRPSYRNFFYPNERWAFTGLRLAEDV